MHKSLYTKLMKKKKRNVKADNFSTNNRNLLKIKVYFQNGGNKGSLQKILNSAISSLSVFDFAAEMNFCPNLFGLRKTELKKTQMINNY